MGSMRLSCWAVAVALALTVIVPAYLCIDESLHHVYLLQHALAGSCSHCQVVLFVSPIIMLGCCEHIIFSTPSD